MARASEALLVSVQNNIDHGFAFLSEEFLDPLPVLFRGDMFLMGADGYFQARECFFKGLLIPIFKWAQRLHAIGKMNGVDLELG